MALCSTALKTIKIIEVISKNINGLTLSEISNKLKYPVSTVFDILQTLLKEDIIVIKDGRLKNYAIGPKLYIYGSAYTKTSNLLNISNRYIKEISDRHGFTGFIVKRNSDECVAVYKYEPQNAKIITKNVGDVLDLFNTSAGKIFIANDPNYEDLIKDHNFIKATEYTITDKNEYKKQIEKIRDTNIAIDLRESQRHVVCIACAIFDKNNQIDPVAGVINFSGLYSHTLDIETIGEEIKEVSNTIQEILEVTERIG